MTGMALDGAQMADASARGQRGRGGVAHVADVYPLMGRMLGPSDGAGAAATMAAAPSDRAPPPSIMRSLLRPGWPSIWDKGSDACTVSIRLLKLNDPP
jgi:hypothetical protein